MVRLTLGVPLELGYDATDAVAVAICHASTARLGEIVSC
jgi:Holliday junction resolvasome RuvABC endonuclease subunit